jgi:hypothetical protein
VNLRFLFIRAAAGTLAIGNAAPVNLPFAVQADEAEAAPAQMPAHATTRLASSEPRGAVGMDAGDLHPDIRLKIGKDGELPCDSGEWANSSLFGPGARLVAALGLDRASGQGSGTATTLAEALGVTPTGDAQSSAFGSVFGNAPFTGSGSGFGGPRGGGAGSAGGTSGGGAVIGGGTGIGGGSATGGGTTGGGSGPVGPSIGGTPTEGVTTPGGPGTGGITKPGGAGPAGGSGMAGGAGGPGSGGGSAGGGPGGGSGGDTSGSGTGGGDIPPGPGGDSTTPPIETIQPGSPGPGAGHGDGNSAIHPSDTPVTGAVPEPASWATMLCGFALIGAMMRRRRPVIAKA